MKMRHMSYLSQCLQYQILHPFHASRIVLVPNLDREHTAPVPGNLERWPGIGTTRCGSTHPSPTDTTSRAWHAPVILTPRALPAARSARIHSPIAHPGRTTNSSSQPEPPSPHAPHHAA